MMETVMEEMHNDDIDPDQVIEFWLIGVVMPIILICGIFGNIIFGWFLQDQKCPNNETFCNLIKALAIIDSGYLILLLMTFSLPMWVDEYKTGVYPYLVPNLIPLISIFLTGSIYCVVSIAVERFLCVRYPRHQNKGAFFGYILPFVSFSVIYSFPKFFESRTVLKSGTILIVEPTEFRLSKEYAYLLASSCIVTGLVPVLSLTVLTFVVCRSQKIDPSRSEKSTLSLFIGLLVLMVGGHFLRTFISTKEAIMQLDGEPPGFNPMWLVDVSHICLTLASSLNTIFVVNQESDLRKVFPQKVETLLSILSKRRESKNYMENIDFDLGLDIEGRNILMPYDPTHDHRSDLGSSSTLQEAKSEI